MPLDHDVLSIVAYVGSTQERGRNIYFFMGILKQTVLIMRNQFNACWTSDSPEHGKS